MRKSSPDAILTDAILKVCTKVNVGMCNSVQCSRIARLVEIATALWKRAKWRPGRVKGRASGRDEETFVILVTYCWQGPYCISYRLLWRIQLLFWSKWMSAKLSGQKAPRRHTFCNQEAKPWYPLQSYYVDNVLSTRQDSLVPYCVSVIQLLLYVCQRPWIHNPICVHYSNL